MQKSQFLSYINLYFPNGPVWSQPMCLLVLQKRFTAVSPKARILPTKPWKYSETRNKGGVMIDIPGFQVEEKIYESVHSVVYRAKQIEGDRPVILKTLREEYPVPQEILRYRREYETTRRLNDAGIPRPIGLERVSNRLILITEDVGGQDLKTLMKTRTFTLRQLLKIAADIVRTLGAIHIANLIHGDIKPSNVVFNPQTEHLQIIDFGSSRPLSDIVPVGENQVLAGTLAYMSPEQTGRMNRPVDWRTDFYSLGCYG